MTRHQRSVINRMISVFVGVFAVLLFTALCFNAQAEDRDEPAGKAADAIKKALNPKFKFDSVVFDEELQMYRVKVNNNYLFVTPNMKYAFIGDIVNVQTMRSILYSPKDTNFSALPAQDAIKMGNGPKSIALFMDVKCPHCRKQFQDLSQNRDVTTYVYLYPGADSVWCSPDRMRALGEVLGGDTPKAAAGKCDTSAMDRNLKLARSLNIRSTPTMIYSDGSNSVGYIPPDRLRDVLAAKGKR